MKCFGSKASIAMVLTGYGYSFSIFLPITLLCIIPFTVLLSLSFLDLLDTLPSLRWSLKHRLPGGYLLGLHSQAGVLEEDLGGIDCGGFPGRHPPALQALLLQVRDLIGLSPLK